MPSLFSRSASHHYKPAIALFGGESSGKTALCASAGLWAKEHGKVPGWIINDPKTEATLEKACQDLGLELPFMNSEPFITPTEAAEIAKGDRWIDAKDDKGRDIVESDPAIMKAYEKVVKRVKDAVAELAVDPGIEPIIVDSGTLTYNWISFMHNGRKQAVGQQTKWGPVNSEFKDLVDGLRHKLQIMTFWEKDIWKGGQPTSFTKPDGPNNLGYSMTSMVRLNLNKEAPKDKEGRWNGRYTLDVWVSQDNAGISGVNGLLKDNQITFTNLLSLLRPELA